MFVRSLPLILGASLLLGACASSPSSDQPSVFAAGGEQAAQALASQYLADDATLLPGIRELRPMRVVLDAEGGAHVRYQQTINGVPVWGGEGIIHLDRSGALTGMTDDMVRNLSVDTTPAWTADEAIDLALAAHGPRTDFSEAPTADLWVFRDKRGPALAWRVQIRDIEDTDTPSMPVSFIDAHDGSVLFQYDNLQTYSLSDADKTTYDLNNRTRYSRATVGDSSDADLLTTHDSVGSALAFLSSAVGRDSYDGAGALVRSYGHYSRDYVNAFWDGSRLNFGDGDGYYSNYLGVLDVSAHELGHGVMQYEANLNYVNESGALNEAASDMLAASVEAYVDGAVSSDTWDIGEDCWIEPGTTALRYMSRPSDDGVSRDHYSARYTGSADSGGVHYNSGIANHWFYLLSEGGQHHDAAYRSGYTVTGLGIDAAYQIWYTAMTSYMTSSTDFVGARTATESACAALGYSSTQCESVSYAWYEVGVGSDPGAGTGGGGGSDTGTGTGDTGVGDTGTGGGGGSLPCSGTLYTGSLTGSGDYAIEPGGTYDYFTGGLTATLAGPSGTDFDLYLYKWTRRGWRAADSSTGSTSDESVSATKSNYYYVEVDSYTGSGSYELCIE